MDYQEEVQGESLRLIREKYYVQTLTVLLRRPNSPVWVKILAFIKFVFGSMLGAGTYGIEVDHMCTSEQP